MSAPACRLEVRRLLALREADELSASEALALREHLEACPSCREAAVEEDPTLMFLALAGEADALSVGHAGRDGHVVATGTVGAAQRDRARPAAERLFDTQRHLGFLVGAADWAP